MSLSGKMKNKLIEFQKRALWFIYKDIQSGFEELLFREKAVSIHQQNLQLLVTEKYEVEHDLSLSIMNVIFGQKLMSY